MIGTRTKAKRGRGRPPSVVSTPSASLPSPSKPAVQGDPIPQERKVNHETTTGSEKRTEDSKLDETLEMAKKPETSYEEDNNNKNVNQKLWAKVLSENRNPSKALLMHYVASN